MCVSHRKWPQDMTPRCGLHSWAVDLSSKAIEKWSNQDRDTLASQNSSDTNMQPRTNTESPMTVLIDVRASSSFDEQELSERRVIGNFLSIFSNNSCGKVVNNKLTATEKMVPSYPLSFSQRIYTIWKNDPWTSKNQNSVINRNTFTSASVRRGS